MIFMFDCNKNDVIDRGYNYDLPYLLIATAHNNKAQLLQFDILILLCGSELTYQSLRQSRTIPFTDQSGLVEPVYVDLNMCISAKPIDYWQVDGIIDING